MKPLKREQQKTIRRIGGKRWANIIEYRGRLWGVPREFHPLTTHFYYFLDKIIEYKGETK